MEKADSLLTNLKLEQTEAPCVSIYLRKPDARLSGEVRARP